jgi:hypothetical protein
MCDIVKTDSLLALLLSEHEKVSFRQLRLLRDRVVEANPDVLMDISGPSVDMAVHYYPQVFAVQGNGVIRARDAERFFDSDYIREEFLSTVPQPVADQLLSCLQMAS